MEFSVLMPWRIMTLRPGGEGGIPPGHIPRTPFVGHLSQPLPPTIQQKDTGKLVSW